MQVKGRRSLSLPSDIGVRCVKLIYTMAADTQEMGQECKLLGGECFRVMAVRPELVTEEISVSS